MEDFKAGTILKSHLWPEPVILELVEDLGDYIRIVGASGRSKKHVEDIFLACPLIYNKEKKLLDGFLTGKTRLMEEAKKGPIQRSLFQ